jgi:DNA-binding beta-propeller fold protein YncE
MTKTAHLRLPLPAAGLILAVVLSGAVAHAESSTPEAASLGTQELPNMNQTITPLAAPGSRFQPMNPALADFPAWLAQDAAHCVVSPDQKTLAVLTSGYNRVFIPYGTNANLKNVPDSTEYVFIYDISLGAPDAKPQVVQIPNAYHGIVFDPAGWAIYVGGLSDDAIHIITRSATGTWSLQSGNSLALGHHKRGIGLGIDAPPGDPMFAINNQVSVKPAAAGVAISSDGKTLAVANYYNDSITVFTGGYGNWSMLKEFDLRPGKNDPTQHGVAGGEYPFWVAVKGTGTSAKVYVSSIRDREVVVVPLNGDPKLTRIKVIGQPNKMTLNRSQTRLYVAEDQSDSVDVVDTAMDSIVETIRVMAPLLPQRLDKYTGANPNSVALSPDEKQLWVTNGNLNCISVIALNDPPVKSTILGLIPTGWYPNSVSFGTPTGGPDGKTPTVYVVNQKSPTGPNSGFCYGGYGPPGSHNCMGSNQYNPQLTKAGLLSFPLPGPAQLLTLTAQVAVNNRFGFTPSSSDMDVMAAVRKGIQHVILIIKENRTYDQVLGDLEKGNGDPSLTEFGEAMTPNLHNLARSFVTLDNFYATAEVSYDGWPWTVSAGAPDVVQHQWPSAYAGRGLSLDIDGTPRNVNVAYPTLAERRAANRFTMEDEDILPGQTSTAAPDGPNNELNTGYLWNSVLRANLTVRNYGFEIDGTRYNVLDESGASSIPLARYPGGRTVVAYPSNAALAPFTDPYFRGFDNALPDFYRFKEWEREFDAYFAFDRHPEAGPVPPNMSGKRDANGYLIPGPTLPSLSLVRFMHDHTGSYAIAIDGVNTPELMQADNDYAVGLLVEKIANSRYRNNTLIFVIEDDAQDGGDHVDSHRTVAFIAGAYVKQGALVSTEYNTIDFVRTIEEVLGVPQLNINDMLARPMADVFTTTPDLKWTFKAPPSEYLYGTDLPLPPEPAGMVVPQSTYDAAYWAKATEGMDFSSEDKFNFADYNRILWKGLMGDKPYPAAPTGLDLRQNRKELLARHQALSNQKAPPEKKDGMTEAARQTKEQSE